MGVLIWTLLESKLMSIFIKLFFVIQKEKHFTYTLFTRACIYQPLLFLLYIKKMNVCYETFFSCGNSDKADYDWVEAEGTLMI